MVSPTMFIRPFGNILQGPEGVARAATAFKKPLQMSRLTKPQKQETWRQKFLDGLLEAGLQREDVRLPSFHISFIPRTPPPPSTM